MQQGGFSAVIARLKEAGDTVADAVEDAQETLTSWYATIDNLRQPKGARSLRNAGDKMRMLQARRMSNALSRQATSAAPIRINVFESYDYDPISSRFRSQIEMEDENSKPDHRTLAETLMQAFVPVVLGVSVAFLAVFSAEVGGRLVEWRLQRTERLLEGDGGAGAAASRILGIDTSIFTSAYPTFTLPAMCLAGLAALLTTFAPAAAGSGIPQVKAELNGVRVPGALAASTLAVKLIGVTLVVASGLPCGREGPMVQLGAGMASIVLHAHNQILTSFFANSAHTEGRLLDEDLDTRDFVSMGAAAGVASAFDAPIGGVLFALEEVSTHWSTKLTWLAFFSALVAALTTSSLKASVNGEMKDEGLFVVWGSANDAKFSSHELPFFVLIGVFGGLLGAAFNRLNGTLNRRRREWYASDSFLKGCLGDRCVRVLEAIFLAWLVASCFFVLPLFYPCSSILEAVAGSESGEHASTQAMVSIATASGRNASALLEMAAAAKAAADVEAARAAAELAETFLVDMRCEQPHSYNQMATITLSNQHHVIQALFTRNAIGVLFTPTALFLSLALIFSLTVLVYGVTVPSGLFVPCMTMGALLGRLMGELVYMSPFDVFPDAGFYALVGAAAMLGGVTRMTFSLTVILCEISNDAGSLLPLMVAVFAARFVGDSFGPSLFDQAMSLAGYPFLEPESERKFAHLTAEDVMTSNVECLSQIESAERLAYVMRNTTHHAFPVVDTGSDDRSKYLNGMVLRYQVEVLLRKRAFLPVESQSNEEARELLQKVGVSLEDLKDADDDVTLWGGSGDGSGGNGLRAKTILLARAAFGLMDADGDGELSRVEMVTCFQKDERVRRLLLPLLPMEPTRRKSIYDGDSTLRAQIDAFEKLFKLMDTDGSGGIDREEWEAFFRRKAEEDSAAAAEKKAVVDAAAANMATASAPSAAAPSAAAPGPAAPAAACGSAPSRASTSGSCSVQPPVFGSQSVLDRRSNRELAEKISMSDFVAARNDARDKPAQTRLTASDAPLLMGNSDGQRKVDLRPMMELAPYSVMHTMPLPRLHRYFRTLGLRHVFVTDTRNEVMGVITRKVRSEQALPSPLFDRLLTDPLTDPLPRIAHLSTIEATRSPPPPTNRKAHALFPHASRLCLHLRFRCSGSAARGTRGKRYAVDGEDSAAEAQGEAPLVRPQKVDLARPKPSWDGEI